MEGKVKCSGCGWSWNKSDSSKKDMYVCHQCGKDNTMKNGGWLNKYDDGGVQPNYNDSSVSMSEDFVGLGYNTEGRKFSPAWGGQFQEGGKLNPLSPMQQVQQAVQPTPTVPYLQTKDPSEFYKSWIQSPEYAKRQLLTGYSQGEDLYMPNAAASRESRLGAIEEMTPITYNARQPSEAKPGVYGSPSYVNINPSDYAGTSKKAIQAHELAHVAGAMGEVRPGMMSGKEQEIFKKSMLPMKEPVLSGVQGSKEREASVRALEDFKHSQEPDEAKADLDALRFMMYDKGIYDITKGKKFTETDFEKSKQNLGNDRVFKRLENRMGKENFVNLMNTIASTDGQEELPMAMGGMSIPGSVGFSYARTAGSAPSEGKYAKKTLPSAQTGIMTPMLLARNVLNYFYPSEETTNTIEAAPVNYEKGLTNELLQRQAYKESTFNPAAVSPAGYKGLTQIGEGVLEDYSNKKGGKKLDPFNPEDAVELQKFAMNDLYNASFINKPEQSDSVRIAKTLAAYNWGRGNLSNYLNEQKSKGVDIYDSYDWLNNLPKETSDYVNKILLQEDPSFNKNYKKASANPKYEEVTSLYDQKMFGGDIPSAQNGQEMRFYQNGLDWKPRSMQDGGVQRISTSDPRYAEMYKNRQVGAYYDGAYSLPDLPEVVVTGKDERLKEAMYEGSNKFGMNALGLMSAPQVVTMEALTGKQQTPSEAFGFQQPGGWLDSPTSFGKNLGNFAMDAVLDPVNLLGVGLTNDIARNAFRQLGKTRTSTVQEFVPTMLENIDPVKIDDIIKNLEYGKKYKLKPEERDFLDLIASGKESIDESLKNRIADLSSPKGKTRLIQQEKDYLESIGFPKENIDKQALQNANARISELKNTKSINKEVDYLYNENINTREKLQPFLDNSHLYDNAYAQISPFNDIDTFNKPIISGGINLEKPIILGSKSLPGDIGIGAPFINSKPTEMHEIAHLLQRGRILPIDNDARALITPRKDLDAVDAKAYKYFLKGSEKREPSAFLNELRESIYENGLINDRLSNITPDILRKSYDNFKQTPSVVNFLKRDGSPTSLSSHRILDFMEPNNLNFSNLSNLLNRLPSVTLPLAGAATIAGSQTLEQKREGGVIKDNRGQWAYPGEVTEIDSNYITMDGVPYDVLGVSNTGDTKLMKPGKNYKFKGKKVTEYPVVKLGINQLDAQPMKKLNQLLNFTNNPDKDNWLDKYN